MCVFPSLIAKRISRQALEVTQARGTAASSVELPKFDEYLRPDGKSLAQSL